MRGTLCRTAASSPMEGFHYCFGIPGRHAKERERRSVGRTAPLLPIAQSGHAHADHERELHLRLAQLAAQLLHIRRLARRDTCAPPPPQADRTGLTDARQQFLECGSLHLNSSRICRANAFAIEVPADTRRKTRISAK